MTRRSRWSRLAAEKLGIEHPKGEFTKSVRSWLREKNLERAAIRREKKERTNGK